MTYRSCDWKPQDDNRLLFYVGQEPPVSIARRLGKTERAVIDRYKYRHGGSFRQATVRKGGMSIAECALALGTNVVRVRKWTQRKGWLKAQKRVVIGDKLITIDASDLEAFIKERGGLLEGLQPTDPYWISLFDDARAALHQRYINSAELSDIFGIIPSRFGRGRLGKKGFASPAFSLQGHERWYERAAVKEWLMTTATAHYRTKRALRAFGDV